MQIRASHIYILFLVALNVLAFAARKPHIANMINRALAVIFRTTLIISAVFALLSFWYEHTGDIQDRGFTIWMVIMMLVGMGTLVVSMILEKVSEKKRMICTKMA